MKVWVGVFFGETLCEMGVMVPGKNAARIRQRRVCRCWACIEESRSGFCKYGILSHFS